MSESLLVGDIETNGLKPNTIWMVGVLDIQTDVFTPYVGDDVAEGIVRLAEADLCIGHHFLGYDRKVIEELTGGLVRFKPERIVDTLKLSQKLMPHLKNHKLETYGELFDYPKLPFKKFDVFDPAMIPYCERDCRLNLRTFHFLYEKLCQEERTADS